MNTVPSFSPYICIEQIRGQLRSDPMTNTGHATDDDDDDAINKKRRHTNSENLSL